MLKTQATCGAAVQLVACVPPLFSSQPARLSSAAAGNCAHRYIGKVSCLLLVSADYIGPRPRARPRGRGE